jgi:sigma-B regulation protein RsbU (phosphoserine phosphatase)
VVVFSGSKNPAEVERSYQRGAASYVRKPDGADAFFEVVHGVVHYWARVIRSQRMIRGGLIGPQSGHAWPAAAPLLTKSLDGTILSWSPVAEELYGYTADEVVGRSIRTLIAPESEGELCDLLEALKRGESVAAFRAVRIHKDGRQIQVSLTVSPLRDGEGLVIGGASEAREIH